MCCQSYVLYSDVDQLQMALKILLISKSNFAWRGLIIFFITKTADTVNILQICEFHFFLNHKNSWYCEYFADLWILFHHMAQNTRAQTADYSFRVTPFQLILTVLGHLCTIFMHFTPVCAFFPQLIYNLYFVVVENLLSEGRLGMSDVSTLSGISGLSFDSPFLSPFLVFCYSCSFCLVIFLLMVHSPFFQKTQIFFVKG